jgi:cytochrome b pre-mRNA-processing protein 3
MNNNYIDIYNKFVFLTRNKDFYKDFKEQDTFSDRLTILLLHFAFFLKTYKTPENKTKLQEIYDFIFRHLELSIREIGYGDQTINKKMKDYINLFYAMIDKIHDWEKKSFEIKCSIMATFLDNQTSQRFLVDYFDNYRENLINNTFNFNLKGVIRQ